MGILNNLWLVAKTTSGRPLSRSDLFSFCEPFIKSPPATPELRSAFNETFVQSQGKAISLGEWYRQDFIIPSLNKVADQPTWHLQRATCLRCILDEMHWRNWEYAISNAKTEWGKNIILHKLRVAWPSAADDELRRNLLQFYLVTLSSGAALSTIARTFFKLDERKETEIDLYMQYGRDIDAMDASIMDLIYERHSNDLDIAYDLAEWKDIKLNPITQQMYYHLASVKDQIIQDTFDVASFQSVSQQFQRQKAALAEQLRSQEQA